jgi:hypothetical protein
VHHDKSVPFTGTFKMLLYRDNFCNLDSFKMSPAANTDGWGNKLVTIFARHHDSFIVTLNFSLICQIYSGSGQILQPRQLYLSPGFAKIAPWWLVRRDNFSAKVPGLVSADGATNLYSLNRRAVRCNSQHTRQILK